MVVVPGGGSCVCPTTGVTCRGRFAGCEEIVSQPGRIPPNAPDWAIPELTSDTAPLVTAETVAAMQQEMTEAAERHQREIHALRQQFVEINAKFQNRSQDDLAGPELLTGLDESSGFDVVDALRVEMRTMRAEIIDVWGRVEAIASGEGTDSGAHGVAAWPETT